MKLYRINDKYINYLSQFDKKIQNNYLGRRVYVGVIINIGEHIYFAPLSSHKESQNKIKKNDTIFRLHGRTNKEDKLGLIHINNMIPVLETELKEIIFSKEEEKYGRLLKKQYEFITSKKQEITIQANRLYNRVVNKEKFFIKLSCDFKLLEGEYVNFKKESLGN